MINHFIDVNKMLHIKRFINRQLCRIFGHKECWVQTWRPRYSRRHASWKNYKVRWVRGIYKECARCGKKLSKFERL